MSCCGQNRRAMTGSNKAGSNLPRDKQPRPGKELDAVVFEYLGDRILVVMGQETRQQYRFVGRGSRLQADLRDRVSLSMVPGLREVPR